MIPAISLVLGLLFNYFFFNAALGLAFPIFIILTIVGLFALARFQQRQINREVIWLLIPLLFFSVMVFVRSSELLTFLNVLASVLLLMIITEISFGHKLKNFLLSDYGNIFFLPLDFLRSLAVTLPKIFSLNQLKQKRETLSQVLKGIFIAIPVLVVFLILFASADLIFQKYVLDFLSFNVEPETVIRTIIVAIVTLVYIGAYAYTLAEKTPKPTKDKQPLNISQIETSILLGSLNLLFLIFIIVQLTYLFGGESNISAQGFTYAQYARRGFFELIAVAILSFFLLLTVHGKSLKSFSTALVLQVLVIMTSAFTRLALYEAAYGFTTQRLYSHALIIFLAVVFFILLYKIHKDKKENAFALRIFITTILFLATMNFLNPDSFIARHNLARYNETGKIDLEYFNQLSADAIPDMLSAQKILPPDQLNSAANNLTKPYYTKWQSLNVARWKAWKMIRRHEAN